ncbi:MAG TPA: cupin domain-containing protein [Caldilineaceae bacterium]|nr:cupin domain-containing protein [Caldilineaceae bacterium]
MTHFTPGHIKQAVEGSLKRLKVETIDYSISTASTRMCPSKRFTIVGLLALNLSTGLFGILVAAVLYGMGFGSAHPVLHAAALRLARPDRKSAEYFTGSVRVDPLFEAPDPARARGALVTFEPGARTAWHTHPLGQTLIVTSGCGWVQREGGPVEEVHPGDVVWFEPGEKHWHGATPTTAMTHIAIQEALDGKVVDWMEQVNDKEYQARLRTR